MCTDKLCDAPQLFTSIMTNGKIRGARTFIQNRTGFKYDDLQLPKDAKIGEHERLVDNRLGIVIGIWLDSKNLQTTSTVINSRSSIVEQRKGSNTIKVQFTNDIMLHQENMGGVNRRDQNRPVSDGFTTGSY